MTKASLGALPVMPLETVVAHALTVGTDRSKNVVLKRRTLFAGNRLLSISNLISVKKSS